MSDFLEIAHVVAMSENGIIGTEGRLPWNIDRDLKRFKYLTIGKSVIMGKNTFDTLPKILEHRRLIVLSSKHCGEQGYPEYAKSIDQALLSLRGEKYVMIAGGMSVYSQTLDMVDAIYLTLVHANIDGDANYLTLAKLLKNFEIDYAKRFSEDESADYSFLRLRRKASGTRRR